MISYIKTRLSMILEERQLKREIKLADKEGELESLRHQASKRWENTIKKKESYDSGIIDYNTPSERKYDKDSWWKDDTPSLGQRMKELSKEKPNPITSLTMPAIKKMFDTRSPRIVLDLMGKDNRIHSTAYVGLTKVTLIEVSGPNYFTLDSMTVGTNTGVEIFRIDELVPGMVGSVSEIKEAEGHRITVARMGMEEIYLFFHGKIIGPVDPSQESLKLSVEPFTFNVYFPNQRYSMRGTVTVGHFGTLYYNGTILNSFPGMVQSLNNSNDSTLMYDYDGVTMSIGHSYGGTYVIHCNTNMKMEVSSYEKK